MVYLLKSPCFMDQSTINEPCFNSKRGSLLEGHPLDPVSEALRRQTQHLAIRRRTRRNCGRNPALSWMVETLYMYNMYNIYIYIYIYPYMYIYIMYIYTLYIRYIYLQIMGQRTYELVHNFFHQQYQPITPFRWPSESLDWWRRQCS